MGWNKWGGGLDKSSTINKRVGIIGGLGKNGKKQLFSAIFGHFLSKINKRGIGIKVGRVDIFPKTNKRGPPLIRDSRVIVHLLV